MGGGQKWGDWTGARKLSGKSLNIRTCSSVLFSETIFKGIWRFVVSEMYEKQDYYLLVLQIRLFVPVSAHSGVLTGVVVWIVLKWLPYFNI